MSTTTHKSGRKRSVNTSLHAGVSNLSFNDYHNQGDIIATPLSVVSSTHSRSCSPFTLLGVATTSTPRIPGDADQPTTISANNTSTNNPTNFHRRSRPSRGVSPIQLVGCGNSPYKRHSTNNNNPTSNHIHNNVGVTSLNSSSRVLSPSNSGSYQRCFSNHHQRNSDSASVGSGISGSSPPSRLHSGVGGGAVSRVGDSRAGSQAHPLSHAKDGSDEPSDEQALTPSLSESHDDRSCFRRFISVRSIAAAMCLLLIVATAVVVLAVTFTFSLDAAQDIASKHALVISSKAKGDVEDFLSVPLRSVRGWQYSLSTGNHPLPIHSPDPQWHTAWWERLVAPMAAANFLFQYAVIGFDDGNYAGCKNLEQDKFQCRLFSWGSRNASNASQVSALLQQNYYRSNYSLVSQSTGTTTYDPRTRGWYNMVNHTPNAMRWSTVYLSAIPTLPIIDVNAAIFNGSGTLLGIASLTFELGTVSSFLANLVTTPNTVSLLIDNEDLLLASSYTLPFLTSTEISSTYSGEVEANCLKSDSANDATSNILLCREPAATYGYDPLRELIRLDPEYVTKGISGVTSVRQLAGKRYYVAVVPIETPLAAGMGWRFALFLPEDDIIAGIVEGRNVAIYICVGVVGAAVIIAVVVITLLLRPLDAVAERMYRVAMMQDVENDGTTSKSALYEISTIQTAFNTMTAELAKIKSFLPQSVLAQLYGALSDDDEEGDGTTAIETEGGTGGGSFKGNSRRSTVHPESGDDHQDASAYASTATLVSSDGSRSDRPIGASLNTSVKLSSRKITMLCLNVLGYHKHVQRRSTDDTVRNHALIVKAVSDACAEFRGVMDGFQGDRFTISFNAVTNAGSHAVLAARTARAVTEAVRSRTSLTVSSGLASGAAMVGNMGSATTKRFTVLSSVVSSAVLLERLSKRYCAESSSSRLLVGGSAVQDLEPFFDMLTLDAVLLPTSAALGKRSRVCSVMGVKEAASDEWMYEMQEGAKNSHFAAANEAFGMFLDGMVCEAGVVVGEQLEETSECALSPDETAARSVLRLVERLVACANESGDASVAGEYGRNYVNALSDYYTTCALPTGCVSLPATTISALLKEIPSTKQDPLRTNSNDYFVPRPAGGSYMGSPCRF